MAQTYLFSKQSRDQVYEHDTSFCFKLRRGKGWLHLNRKATNIGDKFISQTIIRQEHCQELQEWYYKTKVNE
jgi:hypothetical protein